MAEEEKIIIEQDEEEVIEEQSSKKTIRILVFSLGEENYCVDIGQTKEVIRLPEITNVPNMPEFVDGIINLRGKIISVIDVRHFFGLLEREKAQDTRLIVTDISGAMLGIVVDKVKDTIDIEEEAVQPPLATLRKELTAYTKGQIELDKDILILLDLAKVLKCEEIERLRKGE
jgi:purine-binding chemotaxis protein CheW